MRNERFGEYEGDCDDMSVTASYCRKFSRRNDFSVFDMSDYQSCENCRYMSDDNGCMIREDLRRDYDRL